MKRNAYMLRVSEAVGTMTKVPTGLSIGKKRLVFAYRRASQMPHLSKSTQCSSLVDQSGLAAVPRVYSRDINPSGTFHYCTFKTTHAA